MQLPSCVTHTHTTCTHAAIPTHPQAEVTHAAIPTHPQAEVTHAAINYTPSGRGHTRSHTYTPSGKIYNELCLCHSEPCLGNASMCAHTHGERGSSLDMAHTKKRDNAYWRQQERQVLLLRCSVLEKRRAGTCSEAVCIWRQGHLGTHHIPLCLHCKIIGWDASASGCDGHASFV